MALFAILDEDDKVALLRCGVCGRDVYLEPPQTKKELQRQGYGRARSGAWTCLKCARHGGKKGKKTPKAR